MKERPILFSAPMVRALLDGTKTQTRRVVKPQPDSISPDGIPARFFHQRAIGSGYPVQIRCPYGQPGDRLWVRETWSPLTTGHAFAADPVWTASPSGRWHPSIHMPRAASRIDLEVTGVRVERLQQISEADADAEGCERLDAEREDRDYRLCPRCGGTRLHNAIGAGLGVIFDVDCTRCDTYAKRYQHLWESINGPGSWDANPWVWVVTFRRVRP